MTQSPELPEPLWLNRTPWVNFVIAVLSGGIALVNLALAYLLVYLDGADASIGQVAVNSGAGIVVLLVANQWAKAYIEAVLYQRDRAKEAP